MGALGGQPPRATRLLWLGLWPGLDAGYYALQRYFYKDDAELIDAIICVFSAQEDKANLTSISRVVATLTTSRPWTSRTPCGSAA